MQGLQSPHPGKNNCRQFWSISDQVSVLEHEKDNSVVGVVVEDNSVGVVEVHRKEQPAGGGGMVGSCNYLAVDKMIEFEDNCIDSKKIELMKFASNYPLLNSFHPSIKKVNYLNKISNTAIKKSLSKSITTQKDLLSSIYQNHINKKKKKKGFSSLCIN